MRIRWAGIALTLFVVDACVFIAESLPDLKVVQTTGRCNFLGCCSTSKVVRTTGGDIRGSASGTVDRHVAR